MVIPACTCRLNTGKKAVYCGVMRACTRLLCAKVVFRLGCVVLPIHICLNPSCKKHNSLHFFYPARAVERGNRLRQTLERYQPLQRLSPRFRPPCHEPRFFVPLKGKAPQEG
ncbi:unnamed protein product [Ectocarpus sp. 12 AP-2014]